MNTSMRRTLHSTTSASSTSSSTSTSTTTWTSLRWNVAQWQRTAWSWAIWFRLWNEWTINLYPFIDYVNHILYTIVLHVNHQIFLLLTSVVFLPKSKYVANTSSYFACPKESSISLLVYPILARASKTNRCNGIVTTTKNTKTTEMNPEDLLIFIFINAKETFLKEA